MLKNSYNQQNTIFRSNDRNRSIEGEISNSTAELKETVKARKKKKKCHPPKCKYVQLVDTLVQK